MGKNKHNRPVPNFKQCYITVKTMHDDYAWIHALFITLSCNLATYS